MEASCRVDYDTTASTELALWRVSYTVVKSALICVHAVSALVGL